jgi:hypothetical protein
MGFRVVARNDEKKRDSTPQGGMGWGSEWEWIYSPHPFGFAQDMLSSLPQWARKGGMTPSTCLTVSGWVGRKKRDPSAAARVTFSELVRLVTHTFTGFRFATEW